MLSRSPSEKGVRLVNSTESVPANLEEVLKELGAGDHRFRGPSFGQGDADFKTYLQECRDVEAGHELPEGWVPQTTAWLVNESGLAVGMVRIRHRLNPRLLQYGGNIGYYVRPSERGQGYGRSALKLGLEVLRQLGVDRALLTVNPANTLSRRVVLANGGVPDGQGTDPVSGEVVDRFWIQMEGGAGVKAETGM